MFSSLFMLKLFMGGQVCYTFLALVRCLVETSTTFLSVGRPLRRRTSSIMVRARLAVPTPCPSSPNSSRSSSVTGMKNGSIWSRSQWDSIRDAEAAPASGHSLNFTGSDVHAPALIIGTLYDMCSGCYDCFFAVCLTYLKHR